MRKLVADGAFGDSTSDPHPKLTPAWWNTSWIPIVSSGSGHLVCVDLAPGPKGNPGQVVPFLHDDSQRFVLAPSYRASFEAIVRDLERGVHERENGEWNGHAFMRSSEEGKEIFG